MIPKIVHYCWFGRGPYPDKVKDCISSWRKNASDYKFMLWNEDSFDLNVSEFVRQAYDRKQFAFVSDYVRVYVLEKYGGIYLDTDIELVKPLDDLLENRLILGTDDVGNLTAFMASEKNHIYFSELLHLYDNMSFINDKGSVNDEVNNTYMQKVLKRFGYKCVNKKQILDEGIVVFPDDYFHAKSLTSGKYHITKNTYAIHHHTLLWVSAKTRIIRFIRMKILVPVLGMDIYRKIVSKVKRDDEKYE